MITGLFIAFEGGEGAGKSTQTTLLADWLTAQGREVVSTRQPGGTDVGRQIREIVLSPETGELSGRTEVLLYAADKAEHVDTVVRPALERGAVVITDRYVDSALAYQGAGRGVDDEAERILWWSVGGLRPDLTVVLDVAPSEGMSRFEERDRIEAEGGDFHERVREMFLRLAARGDGYLVLDGRAPVETIAGQVQAAVAELIARASR